MDRTENGWNDYRLTHIMSDGIFWVFEVFGVSGCSVALCCDWGFSQKWDYMERKFAKILVHLHYLSCQNFSQFLFYFKKTLVITVAILSGCCFLECLEYLEFSGIGLESIKRAENKINK